MMAADPKKQAHEAADSLLLPVVVRDPRFKAGRTLIPKEESIGVFATLLEEARSKYGETHIETAPAYYEYGNALFRTAQRRRDGTTDESSGGNGDGKAQAKEATREAAAAAAERRAKGNVDADVDGDGNGGDKKLPAKEKGDSDNQEKKVADDESEQDDDIPLALEMMETAWSILDEQQQQQSTDILYRAWLKDQVPRVLTGIGDVLSAVNRHPDAVDAYLRALEHRQNVLQEAIENNNNNNNNNKTDDDKVNLLQCRRKVVEANVLIVEELLACSSDQDVVTTETQTVLIKAGSVVEYARGYYDKARDELQEAVLLLGQLVATTANQHQNAVVVDDVGQEKENICYVATMVMSAGETLAQMDEEAEETQQQQQQLPVKKKAKS